jgi:hypothetical protein
MHDDHRYLTRQRHAGRPGARRLRPEHAALDDQLDVMALQVSVTVVPATPRILAIAPSIASGATGMPSTAMMRSP